MNKQDKLNHYARAANDVSDAIITLLRIKDARSTDFAARLAPILNNDHGTGLSNMVDKLAKEVEK